MLINMGPLCKIFNDVSFVCPNNNFNPSDTETSMMPWKVPEIILHARMQLLLNAFKLCKLHHITGNTAKPLNVVVWEIIIIIYIKCFLQSLIVNALHSHCECNM